jgi:carboxylesterase type B
VTIFGESAGAASVGYHLVAFNGRDDKLFRAAIMESGNPVFTRSVQHTEDFESETETIAQQAGCSTSGAAMLQCLRQVSSTELATIIKSRPTAQQSIPSIDGDFMARYTSQQLADGSFVHVPIITGTNTLDGTLFAPMGINNTAIFKALVKSYLVPTNDEWADQVASVYPNDPPYPGAPYGAQFDRYSYYLGDVLFAANRRLTTRTWAAAGLSAYSYRFNAPPAGIDPAVGATHETDIPVVFDDESGAGWWSSLPNPFEGQPEAYFALAKLMGASWASFFTDLDPNSYRQDDAGKEGQPPLWPTYAKTNPQNMVFEGNTTSQLEPDTWRQEGIDMILDATGDLFLR